MVLLIASFVFKFCTSKIIQLATCSHLTSHSATCCLKQGAIEKNVYLITGWQVFAIPKSLTLPWVPTFKVKFAHFETCWSQR